MKNVYIDFEASQFTQEIISIGAVAYNGKEFYSLININGEVGKFITKLTGISKDDIQNAPNAKQVFEDFFCWLLDISNGGKEKLQFICYGNSDMTFAINSLKRIAHSLYAQASLSLIITNIVDYAEHVKAYFGLSQHVSLLKVAQYCTKDDTLVQTHNSLDDAKMLKTVYEKIQGGDVLPVDPYLEYAQKIEVYDLNDNLLQSFFGVKDTYNWLVKEKNIPKKAYRAKIINKILAAAKENKSYCDLVWVLK